MEERQLIEGCIRGDSRAQKALYELYASAMMSVCQRYVCNRETAKDLLQDGFVRLFSKIHTYSGKGSFKGWMRKIFVTTALEHLRHKDVLKCGIEVEKVDFKIENEDISLFEQLSENDLLSCIANLPAGYRTVFNMHAIDGFTHEEIAKELKISANTSRSQYFKARQVLQKIVLEKDIN